jgi:hypothetical protein
MIFELESEMATPVRQWLCGEHLLIKEEFALPWGICDFVALSFNSSKVSKRLEFGQSRAIGPLHRVELLERIPDHESGLAISFCQLQQTYSGSVCAPALENEIRQLIAGRFAIQKPNGSLQKLNGWAPLHERVVAVELKLSRVSEALAQAITHRVFATESYVAMPSTIADRLVKSTRSSEFRKAGVGVVAVNRRTCKILLPASQAGIGPEPVLQMHCVERFWRTRGSSS